MLASYLPPLRNSNLANRIWGSSGPLFARNKSKYPSHFKIYEQILQLTFCFSFFSISFVQVIIGIISSLIVFPINLIVVQIFRNVRPKPKVKPKKPPPQLPSLSFTKDNIENYNHLKESSDESTKGSNNSLDFSREQNNRTRLSINDVHTDVDRVSFTESPLLVDRRLSTAYDIGIRVVSLTVLNTALCWPKWI